MLSAVVMCDAHVQLLLAQCQVHVRTGRRDIIVDMYDIEMRMLTTPSTINDTDLVFEGVSVFQLHDADFLQQEGLSDFLSECFQVFQESTYQDICTMLFHVQVICKYSDRCV